MKPVATAGTSALTAENLSRLSSQKIFFGHQSVGDDIVHGLREWMASEPRLKLRIVESSNPHLVDGPAFIECHLGCNGDPRSKADAFAAVIDKGFGRLGGIAMYKYCYVDVGASTDISQMFETYSRGVDTLRAKYPSLSIVHVTIPLTTVEPVFKSWSRKLLGRVTASYLNSKRNEFNQRLLEAYSRMDPVFDLAEVESNPGNGFESHTIQRSRRQPALAPELTTDGGHLNQTGRRVAAEHMLLALARVTNSCSSYENGM